MPKGFDWTDFTDAVHMVREFCEARPDWTLTIVNKVLDGHSSRFVPRWQRMFDSIRRVLR